MSNKLIKNKETKKTDYWQKHCELLERQLQELKEQNAQLEITLSSTDFGDNELLNKLKTTLQKTIMAQKRYEKLCNEVLAKKKELDEKLADMEHFNAVYKAKADEVLDMYTKFII